MGKNRKDRSIDDGRRIGIELAKLWKKDKDLYHLCQIEAYIRVPAKYDARRSQINIKETWEETLRVYRKFKKGVYIIGMNGKLVRKSDLAVFRGEKIYTLPKH
jgi:hypothetical protein